MGRQDERRRTPRLDVEVEVQECGTTIGVSTDIGAGGMRIRLSDALAGTKWTVGATVNLAFELTNGGPALRTEARVVRHISEENVIAVEFVCVSDELADAILSYIEYRLGEAKSIVTGLPDAAILLDTSLCAVYYNTMFAEKTGLRLSRLRRGMRQFSPFELLGSVEPGDDVRNSLAALRSGRPVRLAQVEIRNTCGERFRGATAYIPIVDFRRKRTGLIFSFRDETAETRLQGRYANMVTREKLRADRLQTLVTGISHQVNTPLGVMVTANSIIEDNLETLFGLAGQRGRVVEDDLRMAGELIRKSSQRIGSLISALRRLSIGQLSEDQREDDLLELIHEAMDRVGLVAGAVEVCVENITNREPLPWLGFPGRLEIVLVALLMNCLEHAFGNRPAGRITVRVAASNDDYQIMVIDDGEGISAQLVASAFEPFVTSRPGSNMGLGLTTAKQIVESFFGSIELRSSSQGTTVELRFPKKTPVALAQTHD